MKLWQLVAPAWLNRREWHFQVGSQAYCVGKHSTRSKYRGYFIEAFKFTPTRVKQVVIKKGLTKDELVTWIRLMKGK